MAGTSKCCISRHAATSIEFRQVRLGEKEHHCVGIRRRPAHRQNIKGYSIFAGTTSTILQLETCYCSCISTTTSLLGEDLQYNKIHNWIQIDITSTAKPLECASGHLRYVQTSSLQQKITLDIFQLHKHTLRYIKGTMHYRFLISPRLPQGHSLPLRHLIPLNINTYCDSERGTDIDSRKSTSGTVTSVLQVPLAFNSRTQSTVATSSAEADLYAIGLSISDSLHIYQLLQELQQHLQPPTFDFGDSTLSTKLPPLLQQHHRRSTSSQTAHQPSVSATSLASTKGPSTSH